MHFAVKKHMVTLVGILLYSQITKAEMTKATLVATTEEAGQDSIGPGYCGRGVFHLLSKLGLGHGIGSADGQEWERILKRAGWKATFCDHPSKAPLGSILVYTSDLRLFGKNRIGTKGGDFGHVEIVSINKYGKRVYVSDAARENYGGTVPKNFTGRAWIPIQFNTQTSNYTTKLSLRQLPQRKADIETILAYCKWKGRDRYNEMWLDSPWLRILGQLKQARHISLLPIY